MLATEPACVVADEPISSLDASAQAQIANLLAGIVAGSGLGMLFISHDLSVVRKIAHRTVVMYLGRIVESGATEPIWHAPAHPYTRALIAAVPVPGARSGLAAELPGDVPNPARPPSGCRFHPRCPDAIRPLPERGPPARRSRARLAVALPAHKTAGGPGRSRGGKSAGAQSAAEEVLADGRQHPGAEQFHAAVVGEPVGRPELEPVGTRLEDGDGVLGNDVGVACEREPVEDLVRHRLGRASSPPSRSARPKFASTSAGISTVGSRRPTTSR